MKFSKHRGNNKSRNLRTPGKKKEHNKQAKKNKYVYE